jgi:hypothetical protein
MHFEPLASLTGERLFLLVCEQLIASGSSVESMPGNLTASEADRTCVRQSR